MLYLFRGSNRKHLNQVSWICGNYVFAILFFFFLRTSIQISKLLTVLFKISETSNDKIWDHKALVHHHAETLLQNLRYQNLHLNRFSCHSHRSARIWRKYLTDQAGIKFLFVLEALCSKQISVQIYE